MRNTKDIEFELWQTSLKINSIDKEYKNQNPEVIRKGILNGAKALGWIAVLSLCNKFGMNDSTLNIIGTIDIVLLSLVTSLSLGPKATYKFRKKRLEHKLEQLGEERLNSMGIFTTHDYEIILDVDEEEIDKEIFGPKAIGTKDFPLLEDGGKHVR